MNNLIKICLFYTLLTLSSVTADCFYGGRTYQTGASFTGTDGCNTCNCMSNGGVACTRRACVNVVHNGVCPVVQTSGPCIDSCTNDGHCLADQKCCSNGCGRTCQAAVSAVVHNGVCPVVRPGQVGTCIAACNSDNDCASSQKCCSNGCGRTCQTALLGGSIVHNGICPAVRPGQIGTCISACSSDNDCAISQKCCSNGCGRTCQTALLGGSVHSGYCPVVRPGQIGSCLVSCSSDDSCPSNQKCCSNGCGRTCQVAVGSINVVHNGVCPVVRPGQIGSCIAACSSDNDCASYQKCCSNGCGRTCQTALGSGIGSGSCVYNRVTYNNGASFPSIDGCNTCNCQGGRVICTTRFCQNPPQGSSCAAVLCITGTVCVPFNDGARCVPADTFPCSGTQVQCFAQPCSVSSCNVPGATCIDDYCNGCNAVWLLNGQRVCQQQQVNNPYYK